MVIYFIKLFSDPEGETKVSDRGNSFYLFLEDFLEETLAFEFFDELMVLPMCVYPIGHDPAILDIFVV